MKKRVLIPALSLVLTVYGTWGAPPVRCENLETFLSKDQQFWVEGLAEFVEDGEEHLKQADVKPAVVGKLETFTGIAKSYQIPVEDLEKAYSIAVERAAQKSMERLKGYIEREGNISDADIAFLMGGIAKFLEFNYGNLIEDYSRKLAKEEIKKALKECTSLRLSPMIEAFISSEDCSALLKEFPKDVKKVVFSQLQKREGELLSNPLLTDKPNLRYILENLKRFDLAGG